MLTEDIALIDDLLQSKQITPDNAIQLMRQAEIKEAQRSFWFSCQTTDPDFYTPDRIHLFTLCHTLQAIYEERIRRASWDDSDPWTIIDYLTPELEKQSPIICKNLITSLPPQHGKSRSLVRFCEWVFGKNTKERIIMASYNDVVAGEFSMYVRDGIAETKNTEDQLVYSDIFPDTKIKRGNAGAHRWALEGEFFNYLGSGVGGSITGKGGTILITDDLIKGIEEALNENELNRIWRWYTGTFLSRVSAKGGIPIEIMNATRWSSKDPIGRVLSGPNAKKWYQLTMEVCNRETGEMLCPEIFSYEAYLEKRKDLMEEVFMANYHQTPVDLKGRLYSSFKTYSSIPLTDHGKPAFSIIRNYTDTADEGDDYLCSIVYGVYGFDAYVLDIVYTKDPMEITEPQTAKMLFDWKVNKADIESNNGGRGFARSVERILRNDHKTMRTQINWFHQSQNKLTRILTHATYVINHIYFPDNWHDRWPEFYASMTTFQKEGKNKNDDAEDCITGIAESFDQPSGIDLLRRLAR